MKSEYSADDQICFQNISDEMSLLGSYLEDCNRRKLSLFKLALIVFSVVVTALVTLFKLYAEQKNGLSVQSPFNFVFCAALLFVGLVNFAIIKELLSIHASRLITLRQTNSLRCAIDSIRYRKFEGKYPDEVEDLYDTTTDYWVAFGRYRMLPLTDDGLKRSEKGILRSPDTFMAGVLIVMSTVFLLSPIFYMFQSSQLGFFGDVYAGVLAAVFLFGIIKEVIASRDRLRMQLLTDNSGASKRVA